MPALVIVNTNENRSQQMFVSKGDGTIHVKIKPSEIKL